MTHIGFLRMRITRNILDAKPMSSKMWSSLMLKQRCAKPSVSSSTSPAMRPMKNLGRLIFRPALFSLRSVKPSHVETNSRYLSTRFLHAPCSKSSQSVSDFTSVKLSRFQSWSPSLWSHLGGFVLHSISVTRDELAREILQTLKARKTVIHGVMAMALQK